MESVQWMTLFPRCFHAYKIIITSVVFTYIGSAVLTSAGIVSTIISKHIFLRFQQRELIHTSISFQ